MSLAHPHRRHPAYCYCSELEHAQILKCQQQDPLPFAEAMGCIANREAAVAAACGPWSSCFVSKAAT
ncbi:hypothetical protein [Thermostichus sp. MS-CIW-26]